ncbi:putative dna mismatch repair protein [Eutypa lata UCREL1]|uniref:DNA mismatch repair protein PMS1 n=1 Tax=Eutypa lata (strain UCR-EL1) TaxID=1287681 RepID=M7T4T1_EUTLA|nr:putative dna mismatch repair protein [Eutypa lata UCREL1]
MATIKPIEARTIQSGQVIVDLCSVVKELVENSLDAEATNIEVRFKNQGLDSIEVQDNGSGISKENYETLALKHYTSKLSSYSDLGTLQTFGFRGEALSSLCALSKFTVTTCLVSDAPKGSKLEFETSGKLRGTSVIAAQKGTTISVEGLFRNLPVRRRELERNIKREWNKVIGVLNQYACIQIGVKFSVSQQPTKGKRMLSMPKHTPFKKLAFNRQGTETSESGKDSPALSEDDARAKSLSVDPKKYPASDSEDDDEHSEDPPSTSVSVSTKSIAQDAQNLNLISRWIERKSDVRTNATTVQVPTSDDGGMTESKEKLVTKLRRDSEVEKGDNHQEDQDSDLSESVAETEGIPNKVANFRARLEEIRNSQTEKSTESTHSTQPTLEPPIPAISTPSRTSDMRITKVTPSRNLKRTAPEVATITIGNDTVTSVIGSPSKRLRSEDARGSKSPQQQRAKESVPVPSFQGRLTQMFAANSQSKSGKTTEIEVATELVDFEKESESSSEHLFVSDGEDEEEKVQEEDNAPESGQGQNQSEVDTHDAADQENAEDIEEDRPFPDKMSDDEYINEDAKEDQKELEASAEVELEEDQPEKISEEIQKRTQSFVKGGAKKKDATYPLQQTVRMNEGRIRSALADRDGFLGASLSRSGSTGPSANRLDASDAEEKLSLKISKSDFEKMKIIGQFNLGFIIAVRPAERVDSRDNDLEKKEEEEHHHHQQRVTKDDELFIIDQHATDEKYNFERLQASTVVQSQRLVQPKTLELTVLEEEVIKENLPALEANGFAVAVDDSGDQPVGSRCQLLSLPLSRETTFSLADLEELVSLLADHQSSLSSSSSLSLPSTSVSSAKTAAFIPRPSKVRKMFAMRACRSSVMIGKPLPARQMERLVRHMGELDKPWNCPHGRPTMRHLCGLGAWDDAGWAEGDDFRGSRKKTDWASYIRGDEKEKEF